MELPDRFIHQATRYVMGRKTGAVHFHCRWLAANWDRIPEAERDIIRRDLDEAFERDDRARRMGSRDILWLGDDCDRQDWERVRSLYAAPGARAGKKEGRRK